MQRSSRPRADRAYRPEGRGLRALSIATVVAVAGALGLVFFYAPLDAEQGFLQKIFYVHVPLARRRGCTAREQRYWPSARWER